MKIGILAGEASGDLLGAALIQALRARRSDLQFEGIGGPAMQATGCKSLFDMERLSVMGFVEPLKRLPDLLKLRRDVCNHFITNPPDIFIGIDAPDFNLGIERKLRASGIKTVHYVSPSVWAWRQYRIRKIAKAVDLMLTLLPFEAKFYEQHQVAVKYVGHPLADKIPMQPDKLMARRTLGLDEAGEYIALLPGSRRQEIQLLAEPYLQAAQLLWKKNPQLKFITSHVNHARFQQFDVIRKNIAPDLPLTCYEGRSHDVLAAADAAIVTSGTATFEAMLYKQPMVIAYRMPGWIYRFVRLIIKAPYAGLPNLLANEMLVPEVFQQDANPEKIAALMQYYLDHTEYVQEIKSRFAAIHSSLQTGSAELAADAILSM